MAAAVDVVDGRRSNCRRLPQHGGDIFSAPTTQNVPSSFSSAVGDDELREMIGRAVALRDEVWRRRQRAQLAFVHEDAEGMAAKMQREMERLHAVNRDLERRLFVEAPRSRAELEQLRVDLGAERELSVDLRRELGLAVKRSARLAQMLERSAHIHKEQVAKYESQLAEMRDQIRQLNGLLMAKTKSRSIGPTVAPRFGSASRSSSSAIQRRSQSGDYSASSSMEDSNDGSSFGEVALGSTEGGRRPLGIDAAPRHRPKMMLASMISSTTSQNNNKKD